MPIPAGKEGAELSITMGPKLSIPVPEAGSCFLLQWLLPFFSRVPSTLASPFAQMSLPNSPRVPCPLFSRVWSQLHSTSSSIVYSEFPPSSPKGPVLLFTLSWPLSPPASPLPPFPGAG
jgi:hypothetical protein